MSTIVKTMAAPESGLDVRDRMWLKITIPNAFIGELDFCSFMVTVLLCFEMHFIFAVIVDARSFRISA